MILRTPHDLEVMYEQADELLKSLEGKLPRRNFSSHHSWTYQAMTSGLITDLQYDILMQAKASRLAGRRLRQFELMRSYETTAMPKDGVYAALDFFVRMSWQEPCIELLFGAKGDEAEQWSDTGQRLYAFFLGRLTPADWSAVSLACARHCWVTEPPHDGLAFRYGTEYFWIPGEYGDIVHLALDAYDVRQQVLQP